MLSFRPYILTTIDDSLLESRWNNDPSIRHFLRPHKNLDDYQVSATPTEEWTSRKARLTRLERKEWIIEWDKKPIGSCSISQKLPHQLLKPPRVSESERVAWIGLGIGEPGFRGRGIGRATLEHLEKECRLLGMTWIEAGTFEFNEPSKKLFARGGYEQFDRVSEITFWEGRMWDDLRWRKRL
jgi:RimJ/RimL family protein N-acetyltransferase